MSELLVQKIEDLRATGVRIFELIDEIECGTNLAKKVSKKYSDFALAHVARRILKQRQLRLQYLSLDLFSEPAWDILLDLFIAQMEQQQVSVSSACLASPAPATTALRWLDVIQKLGLVDRYPSSDDKRVTYVRISNAGRNAMRAYLSKVYEASSPIQVERVTCSEEGGVKFLGTG